MDTVTHAVIGVLVIRAPHPENFAGSHCTERVRCVTVAAASVFPDLDYAGFLIDPYRFITEWHRGISHSLLLLPLWAVVLGALFACASGRSAPRLELTGLCGLGLLLHILFDLITVYGTQILSPWSDFRVALGLTFDADLWIAAIAAVSLALSYYRRLFARAGLLILGFYLGLALLAEFAAIRIGEQSHSSSAQGIHAIAHPLSPLHRFLVIETKNGYWLSRLDLAGLGPVVSVLDGSDWMGLGQYRTRETLDWAWRQKPGVPGSGLDVAEEVWRHPEMRRFRRFAELPVVYRIDREQSPGCVWFTDLRYVIPGITPPFRYGMCREDRDSDWRLYRLKRFTSSARESLK